MISHLLSKFSISLVVGFLLMMSPSVNFSILSKNEFHDDQRILVFFCLILTAALFFLRLISVKFFLLKVNINNIYIYLIFICLGVFSSLTAYSPRYALYECASFTLFVMLAWLIATEFYENKDFILDHILILCGMGCALYLFRVMLVYIWVLQAKIQPDPSEFILGFSNIRFFNHTQTISLPLLALLVLHSFNKNTVYCRVLISLWWMLLFASGGRGTFIGLLSGLIFVMAWHPRQALPWCRVMLTSAFAGLIAYIIFYIFIPSLAGLQPFGFLTEVAKRSFNSPDSSRIALWQRAFEMIIAHPLLGAGPLHFAHYGQSVRNGAHPHNWILQIASEWGLPALFCISTLIFVSLKKLMLIKNSIKIDDLKNQATLTALLATGVAILVDGMVSGLIVMPLSQLWITLYIGCAWGWAQAILKPAKYQIQLGLGIGVRIGLGVMIFVASVFLIKGLFPEILDLRAHEKLQLETYPGINLNPRVWSAGFF